MRNSVRLRMNTIKIMIAALVCTSAGYGMQTQKELALQLENHPRSKICFLHHYAYANFCDVDERGVYYTDIRHNQADITFTLSWTQVKDLLGQAYKDLSEFDISKEDTGLSHEYREVLGYIQRYTDPKYYTSPHLAYLNENRRKYRELWASGDAEQIKEALKLELWRQIPA